VMPYSSFFRGKLGSVLCDPVVGVMALTFEDLGLDIVQNDGNAGGDKRRRRSCRRSLDHMACARSSILRSAGRGKPSPLRRVKW
jgi:hypothetical protein